MVNFIESTLLNRWCNNVFTHFSNATMLQAFPGMVVNIGHLFMCPADLSMQSCNEKLKHLRKWTKYHSTQQS